MRGVLVGNDNNWYVVTGGPSSGKSTLLEELKSRGYNTIKETARYHIENQLAKGHSLEKIRKEEKKFQEAVFKQKKIIHDSLATDAVTFFDRGYHDTVAYLKYYEFKISKFISDVCKNNTYKKVFVLDMLPYEKDEARIENIEVAKGLHKALIKIYEDFGHEVITVPVLPLEERAQFVLDHID
jgi:predicted ATPase